MATPISSLWAPRTEDVPAGLTLGEPLSGDKTADVVVIGGGVAGLSAAVRLREDGHEVVVLERHRIGGGVSGGSTAKVTALHGVLYSAIRRAHGRDVAARYASAQLTAVDDMRATVERYGIDCGWTEATAVNYATTDDGLDLLTNDLANLEAAGLPAQFSDNADLPFPVKGAVRLAAQAHVHPRRYCEGLARALEPGAVHEDTPVLELEEDGSGCAAVTPHGVVRAEHAVIATLGPIVDPRYLTVRCRPHRSYVITARLEDSQDGGSPVPQDMYLSVDEPVRSLRPADVDGVRYLMVAGEGHPVADEADARACLAELESWTRKHFPVAAVDHRWAAHDHLPSDHLPFIGRLTPGSHRWVATGFQKWGFTTSAVAASIIADGIAGRERRELAEVLDPTRLRSTFTTRLARDAGRVALRYLGDVAGAVLRRPAAEQVQGLANGDGVVVRTDQGIAAVHRDDDGGLHAVSARCTHEGCLVRFNRAQQSWDCPCHGSRFTTDGDVLCGPAITGLSSVEISLDHD